MLAVLDMLEKENKKLIRQGKMQGRKEGRIVGIKEGRINEKQETAKKMMKENIPLQVIIKVTGLTEKEIMKLNAN